MASAHLIRCMYSDTAVGGIANVHWLADMPTEQVDAAATAVLGSEPAEHVQVFIAGSKGRYRAESYSPNGARIRFCGHGALAAAFVVLQEVEPQAESLHFYNADRDWQAQRSGAATSDITLTYISPLMQPCAVPEFAATVVGVKPVAAAELGGASDYLLLELEDESLVRHLQPDLPALEAATQRALIVTAQTASESGSSHACVFRYFAPQYGNPEDEATGSAAVQLAAYWGPRLQLEAHEQLSLSQLSAQGAAMQVSYRDDAVDLAARVGYR